MNTMAVGSPMVSALPEPKAAPLANGAHNRDLALQKYLLLREQHESLRQHLDEIRPSPYFSSSTATTSSAASPTSSPIQPQLQSSLMPRSSSGSYQNSSSFNSNHHRRVSFPASRSRGGRMCSMETIPDEMLLDQVALEEAKLCDVNEGIKRALTELLNCEAVRADRAFRTWVQCRLMDTERELRSGRRRRSAP